VHQSGEKGSKGKSCQEEVQTEWGDSGPARFFNWLFVAVVGQESYIAVIH
jgi:hypothetical protein